MYKMFKEFLARTEKKRIAAHIMACFVDTSMAWCALLHCPISAKIRATVANQMRVCFSAMASQPINALCHSNSIVTLSCTCTECFVCIIFHFLSKEGKSLKDEDKLASLDIKDGGRLYFKDLGKIVIII